MIIVCYDGSDDARAAADHVIKLFHDKPVTVLTIPEPYAETLMKSGLGLGSGFGLGYEQRDEARDLDAQRLKHAKRTADEGAQRLREAGMRADPLVEERNGTITKTVLAIARRVDAEAVVAGTRGRGRAESTLLGSVSYDLVKHADRPVMIVPSAAPVRRREGWLPQAHLAARGQRAPTAA